jgi:hypothetical protein
MSIRKGKDAILEVIRLSKDSGASGVQHAAHWVLCARFAFPKHRNSANIKGFPRHASYLSRRIIKLSTELGYFDRESLLLQ